MSFNRRSFIRSASLAAAGHIAGLRPFGTMSSLAQSTPGYKALVCIFLYGGNDANNTVVPFDGTKSDVTGYANYASVRGPLALPQDSLLQLSAAPSYALHPSLPDIRTLFDQGKAAIVANVGTLVTPLTMAEYQAGKTAMPGNLFSHPDQQLEWQNSAPTAGTSTGWAGRIADTLSSTYNNGAPIPLIASVDGDTLFCNGAKTSPVAVNPGNLSGGACSEGAACNGRLEAAQKILSFSHGLSLAQADNNITSNAYQYMSILAKAVDSVSALKTPFPTGNPLAAQLQQIAQIINARQKLGVERQIFFAGLGNFDTHASQLSMQASLLSQVSPAIAAFYEATEELGVENEVTTFTMSDFSRAFQPNGNDGSDHAWGSHHFVVGGAVKGAKIYGAMPTLALKGPNDVGTSGRWLPTISSAQYAATLASWFGVSSTDLPNIFPTIGNFSTNNLGFV